MTRESILDAFALLIEQGDVASISLAEVARVAGVSDTTIYNHFRNKDDLLDAFTESRMVATIGAVVRSWPAKGSPIAALRAYLRSQLPGVVDQVPEWHHIFSAARGDLALWGAMLRAQQRAADDVARAFQERRPAWSALTAKAAANSVLGVMVAVVEEFPEGGTYGEFHALLDAELARLERAWKD